jgi:hypothetical protein
MNEASATTGISRETVIGSCAAVLAVAAMAVDHLLVGEEGPDLGDLLTFLITAGLSLVLAAFLFGRVVPRAKAHPEGPELAAKRGLICRPARGLAFPRHYGSACRSFWAAAWSLSA